MPRTPPRPARAAGNPTCWLDDPWTHDGGRKFGATRDADSGDPAAILSPGHIALVRRSRRRLAVWYPPTQGDGIRATPFGKFSAPAGTNPPALVAADPGRAGTGIAADRAGTGATSPAAGGLPAARGTHPRDPVRREAATGGQEEREEGMCRRSPAQVQWRKGAPRSWLRSRAGRARVGKLPCPQGGGAAPRGCCAVLLGRSEASRAGLRPAREVTGEAGSSPQGRKAGSRGRARPGGHPRREPHVGPAGAGPAGSSPSGPELGGTREIASGNQALAPGSGGRPGRGQSE